MKMPFPVMGWQVGAKALPGSVSRYYHNWKSIPYSYWIPIRFWALAIHGL
jgi:hypothetical protein